jgi:hypothetical protein
MSPVQEVCIDASIAVKVVVTEPDSDKADAVFDEWANDGTRLIAPAFFDVEIDSILRQKVVLRQELIPEQAETAWTKPQNMPIEQLSLGGNDDGPGKSPSTSAWRPCMMRPIWRWPNYADVSLGRQMSGC